MEPITNAEEIRVATFNGDPFSACDYIDDVQSALNDVNGNVVCYMRSDSEFNDIACKLDLNVDDYVPSKVYVTIDGAMAFALEGDF